MWHGAATTDNLVRLVTLLGIGSVLTVIFVALAFLISIRHTDRIKGIGIALFTWMLLAIVFDGAVLLATHALSAYPLEQPVLAAMMLNPIDLGRVILLMVFDASALMGYTGAVFVRFFGSSIGMLTAAAVDVDRGPARRRAPIVRATSDTAAGSSAPVSAPSGSPQIHFL